jgi:hypothetical protein
MVSLVYPRFFFFFLIPSMSRHPSGALLSVLYNDESEGMTRDDTAATHSGIRGHKLNSRLGEVIQSLLGAPFPQFYVFLVFSELFDHIVYVIQPVEFALGRVAVSPTANCRGTQHQTN